MKDLFRNCIYQGKNIYRDFGFLFWSLVYPLILAIFFHTAFSGISNMEIEKINIGINSENPILFILEEIDLLNVHKIRDDEIKEMLENEEIDGFVYKDLNLAVKKSGINQTIIKEIIEQIKQMEKLNQPIENYDFDTEYILSKNQKSNSIIITFYSLIAMVSTYGIFSGIETVNLVQANLSYVGTRINATPLKKHNFILAGVIVSLLLNLFANAILIFFIKFVLKIELFNEIKYSTIFIILGNLFGVAFGILVGVSNNQSSNVKTIIGIIITLFLSFLSGMMGPWMKAMIDKNIPILNRINPISIITNNLYRINLLENVKSVKEGIAILSIYCIVLILISYGFLRRRSYDSI